MSDKIYRPSRRQMVRSMMGASLLPGILTEMLAAEQARAATPAVATGIDPLAPRSAPFAPRAKRVIFLFMTGGVSHVDTFDPKPKLASMSGEFMGKGPSKYMGPLWEYKPGGKCGAPVSELFPHVREVMDDICLIRSMNQEHNDHAQCTLGVHTGSVSVSRPSIGSWVSYGLGTMNRNLPSFVVLAPQLPYAGSQPWASDFLPACHQGTRVIPGAEPVPDLNRRAESARMQELELGLLDRFNRLHQRSRETDPVLSARIKSFETAYGMQREMPDVLDLSKESDATLELYGLQRGSTKGFGWQCLVARRLAERGVRFVELIDVGSGNNWDAHGDMKTHEPLARNVDKPIAGLLRDLKQRGLLDDTLVVWTTEFGRTPNTDGPTGRGHHGRAYSSWLAGGGVKGGFTYGATDEIGREVAENPVPIWDFHATLLHLLGFDHTQLTYRHAGRDFRLTDVHGQVVRDLLL